MLRPYITLLISKMKLMVLNIDVLLIKVSITDCRRLILLYIGVLSFFHGGHLKNHPKWRVGPKISSVNILILLKSGGSNEQYYTTSRGSLGECMVTPTGPWTNTKVFSILSNGLRDNVTDGRTEAFAISPSLF